MVFDVLLVEDHPEIREIIIDYFTQKSNGDLTIHTASTGTEGQLKSMYYGYDLVFPY